MENCKVPQRPEINMALMDHFGNVASLLSDQGSNSLADRFFKAHKECVDVVQFQNKAGITTGSGQ